MSRPKGCETVNTLNWTPIEDKHGVPCNQADLVPVLGIETPYNDKTNDAGVRTWVGGVKIRDYGAACLHRFVVRVECFRLEPNLDYGSHIIPTWLDTNGITLEKAIDAARETLRTTA